MNEIPVSFATFSTAGNTTLFIMDSPLIGKAMRILPAEQGGCANLSENRVIMAGGEFCLNACLAYSALAAIYGRVRNTLEIAGNHVSVSCCGKKPYWQARAKFSAGICNSREQSGEKIVSLPGISHLLLHTESFPDADSAMRIGRQLFATSGLDREPAAGIIWWHQSGDELAIKPLVMVPGAGTLNLEGACGSGSVALAFSQGIGRYKIRQPSGQVLAVAVESGTISLAGAVNLLAMGELWLH